MAQGALTPFNRDPLDILEWDEFDYLVPEFAGAGASAFLPDEADTAARLRKLAASMVDTSGPNVGSMMPAPYTYLGQFIDHDITLTTAVGAVKPDELIKEQEVRPLSRSTIRSFLRNRRTSGFDLDALYGLQPPADEAELRCLSAATGSTLGSFHPRATRCQERAWTTTSHAFRMQPPSIIAQRVLVTREMMRTRYALGVSEVP